MDGWGSAGTPSTPLYTLVTDYSADNTVLENQNQTYVLQYLVTDVNSGSTVDEVDDNFTGSHVSADGGTATLTDNICSGAAFGDDASCSGTTYQAGGVSLTVADDQEADSTADYSPDGSFSGPGTSGALTIGVNSNTFLDGQGETLRGVPLPGGPHPALSRKRERGA